MEINKDLVKIPILGLDNAGKTSLLHLLRQEFEEIKEVTPTRRIVFTECVFFEKLIVIWDFGGQEKYRKKYFTKNAENYFSDVEDWFYVIDIQDSKRFIETIRYFQDIIDAFAEFSPGNHCNIIINKLDPGFEEKQEYIDLITHLFEVITNISKMSHMKSINIYQTTIENPISVIKAFSKTLFANFKMYDNFTKLFQEKVEQLSLSFIICFNEDMLEIGNYFTPEINQKEMREFSMLLFDAYDKTSQSLYLNDLSITDHSIEVIEFQFKEKQYLFVYGIKTGVHYDKFQITQEISKLINEIKKLMDYINNKNNDKEE